VDDNWHLYIRQHPSFDPYRKSVDFLHRYPEDIKLAARLGVNMYRIGINWARVEPRRGYFDPSALRYYDRVIQMMSRRGIRPLVTLDHWVYPMWVYRQGSWTSTRTVDDYAAYVRVIAKRYRLQVHQWLTFNEAAFYRIAESAYRPLSSAQADVMTTNLVAAHIRAYDLIHGQDRRAQVSSNFAWQAGGTFADPFLQGIGDKLDYVGLDYYYPGYRASDLTHALTGTAWEAQIAPFGIFEALRELARRYPRKPILVTENGMPSDNGVRIDGYRRSQQLRDTIYWVQRARQLGVPVIGYLYWSLTDNYELGSYRPRFGLYTVEVRTDPALRRVPTDGVAAYRALTGRHGVQPNYHLARRPVRSDCAFVNARDRPVCLASS
jgi:beta-glucosidase